ncbi:MAG: zinc-ribbon domain-containing protein [Planctomycetota bacterium]|nr:MAG: zinc-ribbon domain-containing protein [Planctomycetota bacterium]REK19987.1 MAG: zinc-ribbon domain-containing protein [Planctomycetota bacterium]REK27554.1 MAG: zinc-ribbon domain-containing protein [Planctomycetota bacterium]
MTLFIIFGIDSKTKAKPVGHHHCPACQAERTFTELRRSRWFSLFFIPIIPLGSSSLGRVQCTTCGSEYNEEAVT